VCLGLPRRATHSPLSVTYTPTELSLVAAKEWTIGALRNDHGSGIIQDEIRLTITGKKRCKQAESSGDGLRVSFAAGQLLAVGDHEWNLMVARLGPAEDLQ